MKSHLLIPIREMEVIDDEMLGFITAGATPVQGCQTDNCTGNTGSCTGTNSCVDNSGNCENNGCKKNQPKPQPVTPPDIQPVS